MKIVLVRERYVAHGGAERYMNAVAAELARRGHEVHVFANHWDEAAAGIVLHRVPIVRVPSFLRPLTFALNCQRMLATFPRDIVFSFQRTLRQDVYRAGDGCRREKLIQRLRHSPPWKRATIYLNLLHVVVLWLDRRAFSPQRTSAIIANAHRRKEEIIRHYGFPADRIHVFHNGVDCERFRPAPREGRSEKFVLLFVGSAFREKGLESCIRALARLPQSVELRVVGKGRPRRYQRLAHKLRVASRVHFTGPVADMPAVYASGDLLVLPAIYESFANVCLEAMACGLPVITSRINGASEIIIPGQNGAIVEEPRDVEALAEAIQPFLDRDVLASASLLARRTAESLPFSQNVEKILSVIGRVASS